MVKIKMHEYLPGGKIDIGEKSFDVLYREIKEGFNILLKPDDLKYHCHIVTPAF